MSDSDKDPQKENADQTTILHLHKFAPGAQPETPAAPAPAGEGLTLFIQKAAAETTQQGEQSVVAPKGSGALPAQELLGAVSYAYAKGVYRSEDIERKMQQDPELRAATGGEVPTADAIRRFRKLNRGAILDTLARAFRFKRKKAAAETLQQTLPGAAPAVPAPNPGAGPGGETTILTRQEAERNLEKASWVDNMSKDE